MELFLILLKGFWPLYDVKRSSVLVVVELLCLPLHFILPIIIIITIIIIIIIIIVFVVFVVAVVVVIVAIVNIIFIIFIVTRIFIMNSLLFL